MGQEVVTTLTIDADTGGADVYGRAMQGAEDVTKSTMQAVAGMGKEFSGLTAIIAGGGVIAALVGLSEFVKSSNKDLADMGKVAHQVGLTLTEFQTIQFGGQIAGLNTAQINAGLEKSASLLNDASRNSNSLSKELEANGISVRNANGQLITENQLLTIAGGLVKNANNVGDQIAIAQMLGFTKDWIPLLEEAAGGMTGIAAEAKAAGAIIDDETIKKATDFTEEWRKSSVQWSAYMRAAVADILPGIDDLIKAGATFLQRVKERGGGVDGLVKVGADAILNSAGLDPNTIHTLEISPEVQSSWDAFVVKLGEAKDYLRSLKIAGAEIPQAPEDSTVLLRVSSYTPLPASQDPMQGSGYPKSGPSSLDAMIDFADPGSRQHPLAGLTADDYAGGSKVAGKDVSGDAVDRAINSLQKHTQTMIADTQAVGLGDAALAGFRATAAETAAVLANHGKETDAQAASFARLRDAAIGAADALAKAKVAASIEFSGKTAFLSADDVAIANQLKGIYGNDVPAALDSTYAAAIRADNAFKGVSSAIETNLTTGLTDIVSGAKSASQGFTDMSNAIIKAIEQMIIKITIVEPMMRALQQAAGGLGVGNVGSLFGAGAGVGSYGQVSNATGLGAGTGGLSFPMFADGTDSAPGGWSIVGERGPELVNLSPGAQVIPNGGKSASNDNGRSPNIIINNHTDAQPAVSTNSNGDVTVTLKKMVDGMVGDSLSAGTGMRVLSKQYGVNQFAGQ